MAEIIIPTLAAIAAMIAAVAASVAAFFGDLYTLLND